ncbi:MAG: ABC transporter substrate-binding protein [Oscillospiraceae bacterium]|jgi:peptide/nickel transport system substrate-binding protein
MVNERKKKYISLLLAFLLLLTAAGCTLPGSEENQEEDIPVEEGSTGRPLPERKAVDNVMTLSFDMESSLNPLSTDSELNLLLAPLVFETLFEVDESFACTAKLVKDYKSEDGKCWYFYVDTSVKFHDGTTLTAQDAAYSIQRAINHKYYRPRLSNILGVSAIDDELFVINLINPNTQFPSLLNIPVIKHGAIGDDAPAGTGPYKFGEDLKSLVVFNEHPDADKLPIDVIYLKDFSTAEETIMAFEDAELDLVVNDPTGISNLGFGSANQVRYFNTTSMHYLGINMNSSFLKYTAPRYALNFAVDRSTIVSEFMKGSAAESPLPVNPASYLYDAEYAASFNYDLKKCLKILENADVKDHDDDGKLEYMVTGIPIEIDLTFIVNNDSAAKVQAARLIAETLQEMGITVKLKELSWDDYMEALENGDFDIYYGEVKLTADFDLSSLLFEEGSLNYCSVKDPSYESFITDYLCAFDEDRQKCADIMWHYIMETSPIITICFEKQEVVTHRGCVSGLKPTQYNIFNKFTEWTIDLGED